MPLTLQQLEYQQAYRESPIVQAVNLEYARKYNEEHKEEKYLKSCIYNQNNREILAQRAKQRRLANPENEKLINKKYRDSHKEQRNAYNLVYKEQHKEEQYAKDRQLVVCQICSKEMRTDSLRKHKKRIHINE